MQRKTGVTVYLTGFGKGFLQGFCLSYLFYRGVFIALLLGAGYGCYQIFAEKRRFRRQQEQEITLQFREGLLGISSALGAGYSIENAVREAEKDLALLYGQESLLAQEFSWMDKQMELNQPLETLFFEVAKRWNTEDMLHFAQVFQTAKRTGGDLIAITHSTAEKISEKIEVRREIQTLIAGKQMESKIMNLIPLAMIVYFWLCSPGFLDCLYTSSGRPVMTVLLLLYLAAYYWSRKISDICV